MGDPHVVSLKKLHTTSEPRFKIKIDDPDHGTSNISLSEDDLLRIIDMYYDQQEADAPCPACGREADLI